MITENLSTLKIHKLSQEQYDKAVADGNLENNALYLTPDDAVSIDDFNIHTSDTDIHITSDERTNWNAAKSHSDSVHAPSDAEKNQNAFGNVNVDYYGVNGTTIRSTLVSDYITFSQGDNVILDADVNYKKITISIPDGSTTTKGVVQLNDYYNDGDSTTAASSYAVNEVFKIAEDTDQKVEKVIEQLDDKADASHTHTEYMTTADPVGTGSFSMNRMAGSTIGAYSHAEGHATTASGDYSHAEGYETTASGDYSHAEGYETTASGTRSHAEGIYSTASGASSHAEGYNGVASANYSHAEGSNATASGNSSHAEGWDTTASGAYSHAEGNGTTAYSESSHAEGAYTMASGEYSHAEGYYTEALGYQHVSGKYNTIKTAPETADTQDTTNADAIFIVGCGTSSATKNGFRVTSAGKCYGAAAFGASGADFAELFEWADGNPNNEDRRGLFVTLDGEKIRLANINDDYIGIISGAQAFIGNSASEEWQGKYLTDVFGSKLSQEVEVSEKIDELTGKVITPACTTIQYVINPDYNPNEEYIMRENRKEWGIVGLLGQIVIIDDGTCVAGGYVKPSANGIGTASDSGYRVMKRIDENHIKVLVK